MSPRCNSCSGLRRRLPGDPVASVIEKFAVVSPPDDTERFTLCFFGVDVVGDVGTENWRECLPEPLDSRGGGGEIDPVENALALERSATRLLTPSSDMSIAILLGGVGNTEDAELNLLTSVLLVTRSHTTVEGSNSELQEDGSRACILKDGEWD